MDSLFDWLRPHAALLIAFGGLFIAVLLPIWQTRRGIREQRRQSLADQRYAIYQELENLSHYYGVKYLEAKHPEGSLGKVKSGLHTRSAIMILLARPTIMLKKEIASILLGMKEAEEETNPAKGVDRIHKLQNEIMNRLNSSIAQAMREVYEWDKQNA
jgi:hypothetical protein